LAELEDAEGLVGYADPENIRNLTAIIDSPKGTPYEGAIFMINLQFLEGYPLKPPKVRFQPPILHINIATNGSFDLLALQDRWGPQVTLVKILKDLKRLIENPRLHGLLQPELAMLYDKARALYNQQVTHCVK
jgi:ubiquitin-protein ligase